MARDHAPRLRARHAFPPLHVVLVEPEIPPNTGNIARLCAATASRLHLVGTLGFRIDEKAVRRAGIDYWHLVEVRRHLDLEHFRHAEPDARWILFSASGRRCYLDAGFRPGDALIFGRESVGLPTLSSRRIPTPFSGSRPWVRCARSIWPTQRRSSSTRRCASSAPSGRRSWSSSIWVLRAPAHQHPSARAGEVTGNGDRVARLEAQALGYRLAERSTAQPYEMCAGWKSKVG